MTEQSLEPGANPNLNPLPVVPVVGIGASAGGLDAFTQLVTSLPELSGMTFVLVQHLEPAHDSHLPDILSKATKMPVVQVQDGMAVAPNHVFVIPPNVNLALEQGVLRLSPRVESRGAHLSIDFFLGSLARDRQRHSIGVVLSGTGSDGTLGLAEIKSAGGITFAQDPQTAKFTSMPLSAAAAGVVDFVLSPRDIALELTRIAACSYIGHKDSGDEDQPFPDPGGDFDRVLRLLRTSSGVDFTHYRDSTIKRRILRRMALGRRSTLADYVRHLEAEEPELTALYQDILIHVTRFFRDPEVFEALREAVLPQIQKTKTAGETTRVWVAGCATGEEAYSLAIVLCEFQDTQEVRGEIRIFASDISESPSLERARAGFFPEHIKQDVSPERLRRFFVKEDGGYRIDKEIRAMCIFAKQDVTADPPFAKLDLISCRNVLIYLSASLQRRILPTFHYALNPGGFLVLGNSETVGKDTDLFATVHSQFRIYSKKLTSIRIPNLVTKGRMAGIKAKAGAVRRRSSGPLDYQLAADRLLLRKYVPPGVLVNKDMDVLQFRGRTNPFLEPPQGGTGLNLAVMAQEGLSLEIRDGIRECQEKDAPVRKLDVRVLDGQQVVRVNLGILPIKLPESEEVCFLILFERVEDQAGSTAFSEFRPKPELPPVEEEVAMLRIGLAAAREFLQTIREQCETVTEEMKSSNEEMESSNEELQSTIEEMETAKEELQSANEELDSMNEELHTRNSELAQVNDDLSNLLDSVRIPIIMLGKDLCIRRFTPSAGDSLRLSGSDIGRPIGHVRFAVPDFDFEKHVAEVVASQEPAAVEVRDQSGCWHCVWIHPYRSSDGKVDGSVVVLLDIDTIKRAQQSLQESGDYARSIVDSVREPLLILERDLRIHSANQSYYRLFGVKAEEVEGKPLQQVDGGGWNIPELLSVLEKMPESGKSFENFEVRHYLPGGTRILMLNARRLLQDGGNTHMILLAMSDITERRMAERDLRLHRFFSEQSHDSYYLVDVSGKFTYVNRSACERLGYTGAEMLGLGLLDVDPTCTPETFADLFERVQRSQVLAFETEHVARDGTPFPVECSVTGVDFEGNTFVLVVARDITERKRAEEALNQSEEKLRQSQRMEAIGKLAGGIAHDFNNLLTAINGYSALGLAKTSREGDLHGYLEEINKAGERAASLTRQLLAYSRKQVLTPKILNLNDTVSNIHTMLTRLVGDHIRLELVLEESLGLVKADAGQMEQVLVNLVVNARDAVDSGGEITLKTWNVDLKGKDPGVVPAIPRGAYVILSVKDNGTGMDAEVQKRIFEPFFTTKGFGKGTGLGMSVVQGIISQSGGYISVKSTPGAGSEFTIYLPKSHAMVIPAKGGGASQTQPKMGTGTVLLAEDEDTVRKFTRTVLESLGYTVLEADNGENALLVNEQHQGLDIGILVTDMVMPGIGGRELAKRFLEKRPASRVLFMSGYIEDAVFSPNSAFPELTHFIHKPFTPAALAEAIREAMGSASQSRSR